MPNDGDRVSAAWIEVIPEQEAEGELAELYDAYVNRLADGLGISLEGDDDVLGW